VAWNEPGTPGDKDPWGSRRKNTQGSGFEQVWSNIQRKLGGLIGGDGPGMGAGGLGAGLILGAIVVLWLASGFYIVNQGDHGVILRFGKKSELVELPGLHWRLPYPIERVEKVNLEKVFPIEIGYRSNPRSSGKTKMGKEALMLTQDENIIDVEFAIQYKIKNAYDFLFNLRDSEMTIRQATESAVREVVGKSTMDFVLTEGRGAVDQNIFDLLQKILDRYQSGIQITRVEMQRSQPPEEVKAAFDDAVKAREDEQRLKNEAEAYSNDVIPRARGAAARIEQEAEGYKQSSIARAAGDARRFTAIANEYVKAPAVTRERLYIETMEQVLSNTTKIFVDQKGGNNLIYLPLDKLMSSRDSAPAAEATAAPAGGEGESGAKGSIAPRGRTEQRGREVGQ
jgi:modulator of FtsH protease HflK